MKYYAGVDSGGTKTAICAMRADGADFRRIQIGGGSWREVGINPVIEQIRGGLTGLIGDAAMPPAGIVMGMPCFGESAEGDVALMCSAKAAFGDACHVVNDSEVGLAGVLRLRPGINIVAGTGSIAFGKDAGGRTARCGGWDEFYSDEGSCYWMGRKVMETFTKQSDGRLPKGALHAVVRDAFGLRDDMAFIDYARDHLLADRKTVAQIQILAKEAAQDGDEAALSLYEQAAFELFLMVDGVRRQLDYGNACLVSYTGGLFKAGELILAPFKKLLSAASMELRSPEYPADIGALLMCFEQFAPDRLGAVERALEAGIAEVS